MDVDAALRWVDGLVQAKTGDRLSELQYVILEQVCKGRRYLDISESYGCTEGHAKDVGSDLWKLLSQVLGERVTKKNLRHILTQQLLQQQLMQQHLTQNKSVRPETHQWMEAADTGERDRECPIPTGSAGFVGRTEAIAYLDSLVKQGAKLIVIQGEGGLGKTTLAQQYLQQGLEGQELEPGFESGFEQTLELSMAKETQAIVAAERIVEEWLRQVFQEEPGLDFGITLARLKRHLRKARIGVLIDNLEPVLDAQGQFLPTHRNYVELLRILSDPQVKGVTLVTSRDRLCEPSVHAQHYKLPGLSLQAWQQYFSCQLIGQLKAHHPHSIKPLPPIHESTLSAMHHAYGGNAKAMGILAGAILTEYDGDLEAYWQQSHQDLLSPTDLKNLVDSQLERLQHQAPQAYQLFCRLGCYRYQAIPAVPLTGVLALLWDVPEAQKRSAIVALQNRSLIESHRGEYSLHPVLQAAAIALLQTTPAWQAAQTVAAEFWSASVDTIETSQDALRALEAFYHYLAIQDFAKAGRVILQSRHNQWKQHLPLGSTLYRMGLIQPLLSAIPTVIAHLQSEQSVDYGLNELYNILGDVYWITGQVQDAIHVQETALTLSTAALATLSHHAEHHRSRHYQTLLEIDSRLSIGLYSLDLWDLTRAAQYFQQVIVQTKGTNHDRWAEKAAVCLALTQSCLGNHKIAHQQADAIYQTTLRDRPSENRGSFAYFIQLLGQTYVNLTMFEVAQSLFERALSFSEASHYTQVKAKTLTGLAIMARHQGRYDEAIALHHQAIRLLEALGAKCDLAEAYYQCGITHQAIGDAQGGQLFQQAIALFEIMNAPLQIAKVQQRKGV
ncbi:MAG: tetratricopeptide repeat protein [Thermosynechococcaceae cyanobacterium MS004]|nr:tetratricopeptide repeat protein [Thermosynechococcaceae cyanobacterium MS004]